MLQRTSIAAFLVASTTGALLGVARPSAAVDPEELYQAALADMKAQSYASACPKFADARRLKPDSTPALQGLALCYDKLGKSASAWAKYRELAVEFKTRGDARAQAALDRAQELSAVLSTVTIKVTAPGTPGLIIRVDGEEVPKAMFGTKVNVDPGDHVVEATAPGYGVWQTRLTSGDRSDAREVQIPTLERLPASAPAAGTAAAATPWGTRRIAGAAVGGAGVVGLGLGAAFGAIALSKNAAVQANCMPGNPNVCTQTGIDLKKDALSFAHASTAALVIGGAALTGGVVLILTPPGAKPAEAAARVQAAPILGPGTGGLAFLGTW